MLHFNSKRRISIFLLVIILNYSLFPYTALALTGGPSQPEVQSFEPAGTSEMVDLSTGSFTYNIPLLDVGGYPVNISYNAGATMDQEASCVGLGWNINPGVINRNMRGLPDDFDGEDIVKDFNLKTNRTWGGNFGIDLEAFGFDKIKPGLQAGLFFNNYKGVGLEFGISMSPSLKAGDATKDKLTGSLGLNLNLNLNSQNGANASASIKPSVSFDEEKTDEQTGAKHKTHKEFSVSGGLSFNSKQGLVSGSLGANMGYQGKDPSSSKKGLNLGYTGSASFSFARPTFMPSPTMPTSNYSLTLRGAGEAAIFGVDPGVSFSAYYTQQGLTTKRVTAKAYGTLYLQNQQLGISLLDFNREKDGPFTQNTPNLSIPVATQDIYSVAGQGIGGSYLLKRGDIGVFSDKESKIISGSSNVSLEFGGGNLTKFGVDVVGVGVEGKNGAWTKDNDLVSKLPFKGSVANDLYEPAYFKQAGEQSVESDQTLFNSVGGFDVIDAKIQKDGGDKFKIKVNSEFRKGSSLTPLPVSTPIARASREKRNQNISYLTASDAEQFGLQKNIENYVLNDFTASPPLLPRKDNIIRKAKHISEITALREDGMRYIYGIPAYNNKQEDYQFSVVQAGDCSKGLVTYTAAERSMNNTSGDVVYGRDNFYSKETTPAYAHSYLLTAVVSPDYSDVDGLDGPTSGDLGSFTKFNYSRVHQNYQWRLPAPDGVANRANFSPGLLSNPLDNRGSVVYGEKEIWHLHSIESKTQVAQFYYSTTSRNDALGVTGIDAGTVAVSQRMVRLDSIVLYSKLDLNTNAAAAVPLKKIAFAYDQSLCPYVPNSVVASGGKLTLRKIFITYGRSDKGRFSPYVFDYEGALLLNGAFGDSLKYNYQGYNRWGSFQTSLKTNTACDPATNNQVGNDDSPYVRQDSLMQARYATAWNLTKITLPSGGTINVTYESHDYAYTQNKNAMEMFQIYGFGSTPDFSGSSNNLFASGVAVFPQEKVQNDYLYFKLRSSLSQTGQQAKDIIGRDYLKDITTKGNLYFKCLTDLKTTGAINPVPHNEYVFGYADIVDWGRCPDNTGYGFIRLKNPCLKDKEKNTSVTVNPSCVTVNPIAKAGWQFTRLYYPDLIHRSNLTQNPSPINPAVPGNAKSFLKILETFNDLLKGLETTLSGVNRYCLNNNFSQNVKLNRSWVRLYSPEGKKLAGGSRVKRIKITDNWNTMSTVADKGTYGQEFTYRTEIDLGKNLGDGKVKRLISSGVASYEPMIGGDENPFRQPETYDETLRLAPDNHYYQETPFGESFFPSPQIVYSRVAVTTLRYDNSGNLTNPQCVSTGTTVSEYYTAKDYPTRVSKTPIQVIPAKSSPLVSFLRLDYKEYLNASQGFCIELNDMHGKPKAQWNLDDKNQVISGVEYFYKTKKKDSDPSPTITKMDAVIDELDNTATVINRSGVTRVESRQIGVDFQVTADSRESSHETRTRGVAVNTDVFLLGIFPAAAIVPWPAWETEKTRFRSMSISKVINRYALLEKVVAYDASSRIETENLAYDAETGEVLLTRTFNEFGDPIYKLKYPAHFAYSGMRHAYENFGVEVTSVSQVTPSIDYRGTTVQLNGNTIKFFEPGDELWVRDTANTTIMKGWVLNVNANNTIDIIDDKGGKLPYLSSQLLNLKVIRSGKRNMQSQEISMITLRSNPISGSNLVIPSTEILDASVTEYSDYWNYQRLPGCNTKTIPSNFKGTGGTEFNVVAVTNPYNYGRRGTWRPKKSWVHLKDRTPLQPTTDYATRIRSSGSYETFTPFWSLPSTTATAWTKSETNWTWASEATKYNPYGFQLESKDPLGRYSAELPGYGNTQAIAVAANARYREIHFDGFEENNLRFLRMCTDSSKHFQYFSGGTISKTFSHTGDYSMRVGANGTATQLSPGIQTFLPADDDLGTPPTTELANTLTPGELRPFGVMRDSTYWISAWVRTDEAYAENKSTYKLANELNPRIEVTVTNATGTVLSTKPLHPAGNVIDGWQRITGLVTITGGSYIYVGFKNGTTNNAYFDDFRIQPFKAAMKTYVYDSRSTRLLATLDDENYATFYEYNQEGMLERVKRETERGIVTVQETRTGIKKQ
jgi:hypothetical protein